MAGCSSGFSSGDTAAGEEVKNRMADMWEETQNALSDIQALTDGFEEYNAGWEITDIPDYTSPGVGSLGDPGDVNISEISEYTAPASISPMGAVGIHTVEIGAAPQNTAEAPTLYYPDQPDDLSVTVPTDKPTIDEVTLPSEPSYTLPTVPTFLELTIPEAEAITLPTWSEVLPTASIAKPGYTFTFTETQYSSTVLTQVQTRVLEMLAGGTGLPVAIWQAIIDSATTRNSEAGTRAITEATTEFASRGWSRPGGTLNLAIMEARQRVQNEDNRLLREIAIKEADMEVENLRFSVAQGIALETMLGNLHNAYYERQLRAAALTVELAVQVMNAEINLFNAHLSAYQIAATVHKTLIEAEILKLEKFRADLEAQKLKNEINLTDLQLYNSRLEGIQKQIDIYIANLEGNKTIAEIGKTKMEVFQTEVNAYSSQVDAWGKEWDGYTAAVNGQLAKVQNYQAEIQAFSAEMQAYTAGIEGERIKVQSDQVAADVSIATLRADVERFVAESNASSQEVAADAQRAQSEAAAFQAKASFFSSKADAYRAELNAAIEDARAAASVSLDSARVVSQEIIAQTTIAERAWEAVLRTQTQIAASAMAAINVSASISASGSQSESEDRRYTTDCSA